jgi:hypothetical protein
MSGPEMRAAWLRAQDLLVLLAPAFAGAFGQPVTTVVALGALSLVGAGVVVLVPIPPADPIGVAAVRWRAWGREQSGIPRAEAPDRPGRPHPRAPGAGSIAPER